MSSAPPETTETVSAPGTPSGRMPLAEGEQPFEQKLEPRLNGRYSRKMVLRCLEHYAVGLTRCEQWASVILSGRKVPVAEMVSFITELMNEIIVDIDLLVAIANSSTNGKYPYRHSLRTCMLSLAVGTRFGMTEEHLIETGLGCLIHDVGMLAIAPETVDSDQILDQIKFLEVTRHPAAVFDLIQRQEIVPLNARLLTYQMHERFNGSGYPRNRAGAQIVTHARLASVVDMYIALVSPRPHRDALPAWVAVKQIVDSTRKREFDPDAVRAFLQTISMIPIGTRIQASDGRTGQVLRANPTEFAKPIVELAIDDTATKEVVDLTQEPNLTIEPIQN